jgi:hypothetical protein
MILFGVNLGVGMGEFPTFFSTDDALWPTSQFRSCYVSRDLLRMLLPYISVRVVLAY